MLIHGLAVSLSGGYNPYAQQQQGQQQQYSQYAQYDPQQGYQQQQQYNNTQYTAPPAVEQQVYVPPVRAAAPVSTVPFNRAQFEADSAAASAAAPAPAMSMRIGGAAAPAATVSLKIGGAKPAAAVSKPASVISSKAATPTSSKPSTPVAGKSSTPASGAAPAAAMVVPKETKAAVAGAKAEAARAVGPDSDALKKEVEAAADEETLKDLYGKDDECEFLFRFGSFQQTVCLYSSCIIALMRPRGLIQWRLE